MYPHRVLPVVLVGLFGLTALVFALKPGERITMNEEIPVPEPVAEFPRPENHTIDDLLFTTDGTHLVSIGLDRNNKQGVIHFWDVKSRKLVRTLVEPDAIAAAVFTPDGKRLVTACWDNKMRIYSTDKWKLEHTFDHDPPRQTANFLAMFPDGKRLLSGNVGYTGPRIWDLEERSANPLAAPHEMIEAVAVSSDGKRFAVTYSEPAVGTEIWGTEKLEVIGRLKMEVEEGGGRRGVFTSIALSPDGTTIATGCLTMKHKYAMRIWDAKTFKLLHESDRLEVCPKKIAYTPDSKLIVTNVGADRDQPEPGIVYIWEVATGKRVHKFQSSKHEGMISGLSPDGQWLVTCDGDATLRLWDLRKIRKEIGK